MSKPLIFAFDFDGTWTRARHELAHFVAVAKRCGHVCVLVTGRSDEAQWGAEVRREIGDLMPILFCNNKWKRPVLDAWLVENRLANAHCIFVDDSPEYVGPQDPRLTVNR